MVQCPLHRAAGDGVSSPLECAQPVWDTGSATLPMVVLLVGHSPELDTEALASSKLREPELATMHGSKGQRGWGSGVPATTDPETQT